MSSVTLATGAKMPLFGLGTWLSKPEEVKAAVEIAINAGYRLIDTAALYGNEDSIGKALEKVFKEGKVKREEVFVTTKLSWVNHPQDRVVAALKDSLKKLKLDYVDLFLMHSPGGFKAGDGPYGSAVDKDGEFIFDETDYVETWKGMEAGYKAGLTKAIGISNFNQQQTQRLCDNSTVKPHNLQFELHEFCKKNAISFTAYSPIGSPGRGEFIKDHLDAARDLDDSTVKKLTQKYEKTPAQILIRYLMERNISTIPKSTNPERIKQNCQVFDFELSDSDMKELNSVNVNKRLLWVPLVAGHINDPLAEERKLQKN